MVQLTPLFINGERKLSAVPFDVINPASSLVVGQSANASSEDCQAAVNAAASAFKTWEHSTDSERRAIFLKAAELIATDKYKNMVNEAIQSETAAQESWCILNYTVAGHILRTCAGLVGQLKGEILPSVVPGAKLEVHRRAIGVMQVLCYFFMLLVLFCPLSLSIAPWNAPLILSLRAVAIPLICGNTVVLKSSEYSPRSQAIVFELLHEAGLPPGVLNYISVSRKDAPARTAELIAHPAVRKVTFTGSDRVGRIIAVEAAKHLKPCIFELGGKAPVIVLNDADVSAAARAITTGAFTYSGQVCMSSERVIVQANIAPRLVAAVRDLAKDLEGKLGPLFNEGSAENVVSMVKESLNGGAELLLGDLTRQRGVVQPHLVKLAYKGSDTGKGLRVWEQESFGPGNNISYHSEKPQTLITLFTVLVFVTVDTVDDAVELANASEYSLTAAVWANDVYAAQGVAARVRAGFVNINGSTIHTESYWLVWLWAF
ncbi:hypothetical protein DXG01_012020 [Tephrocybe rancida]|nr:hypothetical protein DXG01_012020 [Tephrocybe rancida]